MNRPSPVVSLFLSLALNFVTVATACCVALHVALLGGRDIELSVSMALGVGLAVPLFLGHAVVVALCWPTAKMSGRGLYVLSVVAGGVSVGVACAVPVIADVGPCWLWVLLASPTLSALVSLVVVVLPPLLVCAIKDRRKTSGPSGDGPLSKP